MTEPTGYRGHGLMLPVMRDGVSLQIDVPILPTNDEHAASKFYVDNIGSAVTTSLTTNGVAQAIDVSSRLVRLTSTTGADLATLANGTQGQLMSILYVAEGAGADVITLTPASSPGYTTITFNGVGDAIDLVYNTVGGWFVLGGTAVVA